MHFPSPSKSDIVFDKCSFYKQNQSACSRFVYSVFYGRVFVFSPINCKNPKPLVVVADNEQNSFWINDTICFIFIIIAAEILFKRSMNK